MGLKGFEMGLKGFEMGLKGLKGLKGGWWFGRLRMEARLHSQAHKEAT